MTEQAKYTPQPSKIHIVFDGPPSHESGRFIEVENDQGQSISIGEWRQRTDGLWELVIDVAPTQASPDLLDGLEEICGLSRHLRVGGASIEDLEGLDAGLNEAVVIAAAILAKAKGQG